MLVLKRSIGSDVALKAALNIALTGLVAISTACSVAVTDDTGTMASSEYNASDNSNAMAMPPGTNAAAKITLPMELIASDRSNGGMAGKTSEVGIFPDEATPTKISLGCVPKSPNARDGALVMGQVNVDAELLEVVGASDTETKVVASLQRGVRCADFVLSMQNLPVGKNLVFAATIGNQLGAFSGQTEPFTFNGIETLHLVLKMKPVPTGADAVVDVSFDTPSGGQVVNQHDRRDRRHGMQILKQLFQGQAAVNLNQILLKNAPDSKKTELCRRDNTECHSLIRYGSASCIMINKQCTLNGTAMVEAESASFYDALSKASLSLIQDKTKIAVHALMCQTIKRQKDPQAPAEEATFCYGIPGIGPELDGRVTIQ